MAEDCQMKGMISYRCALCGNPARPRPADELIGIGDVLCQGCCDWLASNPGIMQAWLHSFGYAKANLFIALENVKRTIDRELGVTRRLYGLCDRLEALWRRAGRR